MSCHFISMLLILTRFQGTIVHHNTSMIIPFFESFSEQHQNHREIDQKNHQLIATMTSAALAAQHIRSTGTAAPADHSSTSPPCIPQDKFAPSAPQYSCASPQKEMPSGDVWNTFLLMILPKKHDGLVEKLLNLN